MNDDQHMWVCGSFFQFSAGGGWTDLKGFDLSEKEENVLKKQLSQKTSMFVVQATKESVASEVNYQDPESSFMSGMWMSPTLEERDKMLLAPRLARAWEQALSTEMQDKIFQNVKLLPGVYDVLTKMDGFAFPFNLQGMWVGCEGEVE